MAAYDRLGGRSTEPLDVAVRSSATAEDLPDASFAGQQETYLNVQGHAALLETLQALLRLALHRPGHLLPRRQGLRPFQDRALDRRAAHGALRPGASGVMFSIDTETGFRDAVLINAAYGLGENVVQGSVNPDEYYVFKPTLETGFPADPPEDASAPRSSS